jgi:hypothetical protein
LDAAFAFPKVCHVPSSVSNDLNFDMPKAIHSGSLCKHLLRRALFDCSFDQSRELVIAANETDASPSTSVYCFDHDWEANF